jgi:hypothetical protein
MVIRIDEVVDLAVRRALASKVATPAETSEMCDEMSHDIESLAYALRGFLTICL